jgi:threonine dehydrogenase-like Zn-dependent dehydrogenase
LAAIKEHGFNVFFDALGGGPVLEKLIHGLSSNSWVHVYGYLEAQPLQIPVALSLSRGVYITGYMLFTWYSKLGVE